MKVGIQGIEGSFSEEAAKSYCEKFGIKDFELKYLVSSMNVLDSLSNNSIDTGIFAMENAQGGVVIESVKALAKYRCQIIEMFHITVIQNLLTLENINLGDITEIHSHQQALRQCKNYLSDHFWTRPLIESDDTAEAARRLSEGELIKSAAVIGNKSCADLYNLKILKESIHDLKNNLTLFIGIKKF